MEDMITLPKGKVLFLVNHEVVIYNFRRELVERLLAEGYGVFISSPWGERINELISMGCQYVEANIERHGTNPLNELKLLLYYRKIIRRIKPDVVLTYTIKPNIYGGIACQCYHVPYIVNITGLGVAVEKESWIQKIVIMMYKIALKNVSCLFLQNTENQQFFIDKNIAVGKHRLIPGSGVNLEHFRLLEYPSDETIEFAFISRIMKEKGIEQYLEAAEYIKNKYPNTRFHVCGFCEEGYEEKLVALQEKSIILYHGMVKDVRTILAFCHCIIHPTYYPEGMSNVLLESIACGRPIITTNRSGCREIIDDEVNGYLIKQQNTQDLIDQIERFLHLDYKEKHEMGLHGRLKAEKEFNRQIITESYLEEINLCRGDYNGLQKNNKK